MIVVVAGVSGSGKSTVGALLATRLGWPFTDGDALHPAANVAKMRAGHPLTDADREPWLAAVTARIDSYRAADQPAVLACSALKRRYRDELTAGRPDVRIVFLATSRDVLRARLVARHGHFFPAVLLDTQLADAQAPEPAERALVVDETGTPDDTVRLIMSQLHLEPAPGKRTS